MIKFFNKIRYDLMEKNKTGKYLKYAVGEIILVVIGILIALSVNNWNQEKKDRQIGEDYLLRIHRDLVQDTINFRSIITNNNKLREDIKRLLVSIYAGVDNIEQVQNMSAIFDQALDQVFAPNDNTYKGMASSGTLSLILNKELKEEIIDLYSEYDQNKALLSSITEWMVSIATTLTLKLIF